MGDHRITLTNKKREITLQKIVRRMIDSRRVAHGKKK